MRRYKKYTNRRLYDCEKSRYCTLPEVIKAVRAGETVAVEGHDGGTDITCEILLEALKVQELKAPKLTAEELHRLLRA